MERNNVPVIVTTYNRLDHTKIVLESLAENKGFKDHPVVIYSDGPRKGAEESVLQLREYLDLFAEQNSNVTVVKREENMGLASSLISAYTEILNKYGRAIMVEDDLRLSPMFLGYMTEMLERYSNEKKLGSITGYNNPPNLMKIPKNYQYDVYFVPRTSSWGWATWKDRWDDVDWEVSDFESFVKDKRKQKLFNLAGSDMSKMLKRQVLENIDTWDIQWAYHNFKKGRLTMYPCKSYVENIGQDGSGIHCLASTKYAIKDLNNEIVTNLPDKVEIDNSVLKAFKQANSLSIRTIPLYMELVVSKVTQILKR